MTDVNVSSIGGKLSKYPYRNLWRHCRELQLNIAQREVHDALYAQDVNDLQGVMEDAKTVGIDTRSTRKKVKALREHTTPEIAGLLQAEHDRRFSHKCPFMESGDPSACHTKCPVAGAVMEQMEGNL